MLKATTLYDLSKDILVKLLLTVERNAMREMLCSDCRGNITGSYLKTSVEQYCHGCECDVYVCEKHDRRLVQHCMYQGCSKHFCNECAKFGYIACCKECEFIYCNSDEHDIWSYCKLCHYGVCKICVDKHKGFCSSR